MVYKLVGFAVIKGARYVLRRRYGHLVPPRPVIAGGLVVVGVGVAAALSRGSDSK